MLVSARQRQEPALPGTATPPGVIAPNAVSCRDPVGLRPRPYRATGCELQIGVVVNRCDHIRSNTAQLVVDVMQRRCILAPSLTPVEAWLRSWLTTGVILPNSVWAQFGRFGAHLMLLPLLKPHVNAF